MVNKNNLKVGIISDGKYGERAFENIKKTFNTTWIMVPDIDPNLFIDNKMELNIPDCDIYISYVRHPDIILQIAELNKPLILGVLPGYGLYQQAKAINKQTIHAPTMCSLENNTGIAEIDLFTSFYGRPQYEVTSNEVGTIKHIKVQRSSLCGSSEAGAKYLLHKQINEKNLQDFALNVCHECRAPRFGRTCDKEVAGIIHLKSLIESFPIDTNEKLNKKLREFIESIKEQYNIRHEKSLLE
jgi:hypothetical protein